MTNRQQKRFLSVALLYCVLIVSALVTLVPFVYMICASFRGADDSFSTAFLPRTEDGSIAWSRFTLENFRALMGELNFSRHILNSTFLASVTSVLATLFSCMGGYALAKFRFPGREFLTNFVLSALVLPGVLLLAPTYQLLYQLGLLDSYAGLILPAIAPAFGVFLFRQAIMTSVPDEILESSRIDGASEITIFVQMVLPLVRPMIGAFLLITFLGTWNNYIGPQIVLQTPEKYPLAVAVAQLRGVYSQNYGMLMAGTLASVAPILLLFLMLQREFISGLTAGAVKG